MLLHELYEGVKNYTDPNFDIEWEEANRYPEFVKLGKAKWIALAKTGRVINVDNALSNKIENTEAGEKYRHTFDELEADKKERFYNAAKAGEIELPIIASYSDGRLELVAGNTRLTGMMSMFGSAKAWIFDVPNDLIEARLQPDQDYLSLVGNLLNDANADYANFLKNNNDKDDMDELVDILQSHSNADELDLNWHVGKPNKKAVDWYIQSAIVHGDGSIDVILDPDSTIGHWGPKSFKDSVLKTLAHETIHLAQRDRMGAEKYKSLPSGYMQGVKKAKKSGKERDMIRTYFRDPHELMAHGHDLAQEIMASSNPEDALRNPEKYRDELPAYDKHRQIFPPNAKPLQRLLSYASGYIKD